MSWTYTRFDTNSTTLKNHLDNNWSYNQGLIIAEVVISQIVNDVYYAAVKRTSKTTGLSKTSAIVAPIERYTGGNYAFNAMGEGMLPYSFECPKSVLKALSPTDDGNSLKWRQLCQTKTSPDSNTPN